MHFILAVVAERFRPLPILPPTNTPDVLRFTKAVATHPRHSVGACVLHRTWKLATLLHGGVGPLARCACRIRVLGTR